MCPVRHPPLCRGATRLQTAFHERVSRKLPLPLLLLLVFSGCNMMLAPQPGDLNVEFTTDQQLYAPGAEIVITLTNRTKHGIGYNLCVSGLEEQVNGEWRVPENLPRDVLCLAVLKHLHRGRAASTRFPLPEELPAGEYRLFTNVEDLRTGEQALIATSSFVIAK